MQQATIITLGTIKPYGTLSGYIYLHLPQYLCKQFGISKSTSFSIIYKDGRVILEQILEDKKDYYQSYDKSFSGDNNGPTRLYRHDG